MNRLYLISFLFLFSINLFSWTSLFYKNGLCNEEAYFSVATSSFSSSTVYNLSTGNYITNNFQLDPDDVKEAAQLAANWWNEAGSEHKLNYVGEGYSGMPIYLSHYDNSPNDDDSYSMRFNYLFIPVNGGWCMDTGSLSIEVNEDSWNTNMGSYFSSGIDFITTLTHEFGHSLGLAHYEYSYNIMRPGHGLQREIHEDDKYGVQNIYGYDERIIRTTRGVYNDNANSLTLNGTYWYQNYNAYETFAKPNIVFQPDPNNIYNWDYIITWVSSDNKHVRYAFVEDGGSNIEDLRTVYGPYEIAGYETMTSPSIAISGDGTKAMIVFKEEKENQDISESGRIIYVKINPSWGGYDTPLHIDGDEYTKSAPIVLWNEFKSKFIIFWNERGEIEDLNEEYYNWNIKYSLSNSLDQFDSSKALEIKKTVNYSTYHTPLYSF